MISDVEAIDRADAIIKNFKRQKEEYKKQGFPLLARECEKAYEVYEKLLEIIDANS